MFKFRLEKLKAYRALLEEQAKRTYLERKAFRIATEGEIVAIHERRHAIGRHALASVTDRIDIQGHYTKADDDETAAKIALAVLENEEAAAERAWISAKQELQVIEKLRENAYVEWQLEEGRREQSELDEWAVLRRRAA